ncbi:MAG: NCS2 family permease [Erysipelotrichaceae bacterium]
MLEKVFKLRKHNTTVRTEIIAGFTTFLTMAYILGVNPGMLADAGMDFQSVFLATAIASGVACIIMGLVANYPVALAPGMGVNAFFTYTIVLTYGYTWQEALAAVFLSGIIFLIISFTGVRKNVINAIPPVLKNAIGAGIGFFIAFLGLKNAGIIVANPSTFVGLGELSHPTVLLCVFGVALTIVLLARKVKAAVFFGMLGTAILGVALGFMGVDFMPALPTAIFTTDFSMPTLGAFVEGLQTIFTKPDLLVVLFSLLFVDFFDTAGTLVAIGNRANLMDEKGELIDAEKAFAADSVGSIVGACMGTSTVTSYVESTAGVEAGGRTGLTAVVVGILFLLSVFVAPALSIVGSIMVADGVFLSPITSPALIVVGILMIEQVKHIDWDDLANAAPSFMTIIFMVLSFSIADGIAMGFLTYGLVMVASGRAKEVKVPMWVIIAIFMLHFVPLG